MVERAAFNKVCSGRGKSYEWIWCEQCLYMEGLLKISLEQIPHIKRKLFLSKQQTSRTSSYLDPNLIFLTFIIVIFWLMLWLVWWDWYVCPHIDRGCGRNRDSLLTPWGGGSCSSGKRSCCCPCVFGTLICSVISKCDHDTIQLKIGGGHRSPKLSPHSTLCVSFC